MILLVFISFFPVKALKMKYPNEDWAQVQGRMLGLVNLSTEDDALNRSLNKVCLCMYMYMLEQGWGSGESTCLPPEWPGFNSRYWRHM